MGRASILSAVTVLLVMAGCAPSDPLEQKVSATTADRFATWRAHIMSDSGAETRRRVEEALQEIRLQVAGERELKRAMGERVTSGTDVIDEAVRERVNGRRLVEVLQLGYELRVRRLKEELAGLQDAMSKNAQLITRPGDLESKHHLEGLQERQRARVEKYRADVAAAEKELAPLAARTGRTMIERPIDPPNELPVPSKKTKEARKI